MYGVGKANFNSTLQFIVAGKAHVGKLLYQAGGVCEFFDFVRIMPNNKVNVKL